MAKVLITGGAGFIGSHTADQLFNDGMDIRILDSFHKNVHRFGIPNYLNKKFELIIGDVCNKNILSEALKDVEYIIHLAAYQDYLNDFSNFFHVNSYSTALIYEIILEQSLKIKKIVVASSQFVQGEGIYKSMNGKLVYPNIRLISDLKNKIWDFYDEKGNALEYLFPNENYSNPPNSYAISKLSQEHIAIKLGERYSIPSVAMRYSIVQGARQSVYNAYSGANRIFNLCYFQNIAPEIFEDGNQLRDFVNIKDVVSANKLVLLNDNITYESFCVGGGKSYRIVDFAREVARIHNKEEINPLINSKFRVGDTRNAVSDISKLKKFGWSPKFTITDSILEYKDYLSGLSNLNDIIQESRKTLSKLNVVMESDK